MASRLRRETAFWLLAATLVVLLFASTAPSPLYGVYQARWGFSALTLTVVFSVFALALLATLVTAGAVSDHAGRRPVVLAGLAVELAAMLGFVAAAGTAWLFAARVLQGVGTGLAMGAIGAALLDLRPRFGATLGVIAPLAGLALGALGAAALVQYGPDPTRLVFWALAGTVVLIVVAVSAVPETVGRPGAWRQTLRPTIAVPRRLRADFAAAVPCLAAPWALGGLVLSLGPSIMARALDEPNHVVASLPIVLMAGISAATSHAVRDAPARTTAQLGLVALAAGVALALLALDEHSSALFLAGAAVAGLGYGPAYAAGYRALTARAERGERAGLVAAILTVAYLAFSVPAVLAGLAVTSYGLRDATYLYGAGLILAACLALALSRRMPR